MGALYSRPPFNVSMDHFSQAQKELPADERKIPTTADIGDDEENVSAAEEDMKLTTDVSNMIDENIDLLSQKEMENEFKNIYERSHSLLNKLTMNPCEQLSIRIRQCLENNSKEMSKCFAVMKSYESCLADHRHEKLTSHMQNVEQNVQ